MKRKFFTLLLLLLTVTIYAQNETWYIQVGVFENRVDIDYFNNLGSDISHSNDGYGFHRYYKGNYNDKAEAEKAAAEYKEMGYNCVLTSKSELDNACVCSGITLPDPIRNSIQNIFFDFDKSFLRPESKQQLDDLVQILNEHPDYTTNLRAHTDSKGSITYNEALSMRRANSAKRYLISRGIAASRLSTAMFGENTPIAKNELNDGQDTEQGRQFNRRVEIQILNKDGIVLNEIVDDIEVPDGLLTSN